MDALLPHDFHFEAIGTQWCISTPDPLSADLRSSLLARVGEFDATWSRFRDDSIVAGMSRHGGSYSFPPEAEVLGRLYRDLHRITDGAMTPLIGASLERLGYDAGYSLKPAGAPLPALAWDDVLDWDGTTLRTLAPVVLDIGAAGKGLLVDILGGQLEDAGLSAFVVDGSGDLLARGAGVVSVGLEHPYDPTRAIGTFPLRSGALCASAANRRAWGDGFHHVLDATTGMPVRTVVATWAAAETAMVADALATALFFAPGAQLEEQFEFSWLTVFADGSAAHSQGFEGTLFS
ncbi:FAD:protein FMN transferase [Pseudarthrobacter sp. J75]|uniref:FAD:protein FMN transferase n=1 Tax=unclassified Pseudarthrobacter TaxID=2647000 RepID=UPI002E804A8A|nr:MULTISPECIES: FAD:protein FMN transferase [unclassified Pseudarthrobacter]MEE2521451.1 FAD:protein FMN transferase [Pseudarthrobacter sp. J47]MEE2528683.1 FAD:protein FMN transferase [Pseudarthrobacter sp. J75]